MKFLTPNYFHLSVLVTSPLSWSDLIDAINQSRISLIIKQLRLKSLGFRAADRKNTPNQICDCAPITKVETINFLFKFPSNLPMNTSNWSNWNNSTCGPRRFFPFSQGLIELIQQSPECAADVVSFRYIFFSLLVSAAAAAAAFLPFHLFDSYARPAILRAASAPPFANVFILFHPLFRYVMRRARSRRFQFYFGNSIKSLGADPSVFLHSHCIFPFFYVSRYFMIFRVASKAHYRVFT